MCHSIYSLLGLEKFGEFRTSEDLFIENLGLLLSDGVEETPLTMHISLFGREFNPIL